MSETQETVEMLIVTDKEGRIAAATFPASESQPHGLRTALALLPGQQMHKVEAPAVIASLNGRDLQLVLSQARIEPATSRFTLPEIKITHPDH